MRKKLILIPTFLLVILVSTPVYAACAIDLIPDDYENEKCLSLKAIQINVTEDGKAVEEANVTFVLSTINGYKLLKNNILTTNLSGIAENKVLFGYYGNVTISYSAEYNSLPCTGSGAIKLSIGEQNLYGNVYDSNNGSVVESIIIITHLYNGEILYLNEINGSYSINLPVCDYLISTIQSNTSGYHQVLRIEANMTKEINMEKNIPITKELCNNIDDDGDLLIDEDFEDPDYNNFGPKGSSCKAIGGVCSGNYICSEDMLSTKCNTQGSLCHFCYNITTDPDNDYDAYLGECSYSGICMLNMGYYYSSFLFNPFNKVDCGFGCMPVTSDINATLSAICT